MLGIATASDSTLGNYQAKDTIKRLTFNPREQKSDYVFLYFTEAKEGEPLRNRIYGYEWNGQDLINPVLIIDLPAMPGPYHDGGKLTMGPDNHLYAVIGHLTSVAGPSKS